MILWSYLQRQAKVYSLEGVHYKRDLDSLII